MLALTPSLTLGVEQERRVEFGMSGPSSTGMSQLTTPDAQPLSISVLTTATTTAWSDSDFGSPQSLHSGSAASDGQRTSIHAVDDCLRRS